MIGNRFVYGVVIFVLGCGLHTAVVAQTAQTSDRAKAQAKKIEGDKHFQNKQFQKAQKVYQRAIQLDPLWYKSYEALGNLHFSQRQYVDAIEAFMKAIEVEPRYHTGYYNIAFAYRKSLNYEKAIKYYQKYLQRNSSDPDAYYGMAASYESLGKSTEAIAAYQRYVQMEKRPSEKKYVIRARQKAESLAAQLETKETKPNQLTSPSATTPTLQPSQSTPKTLVEKRDKPVADKTVVTAQNKKIDRWIALGDKAYERQAYSKAMKYYFDAAREQPKHVDAVYKLGLVYQKTGNDRAARLKWSIVLRLDPDHRGAKAAMAKFGGDQPGSTIKAKPVQKEVKTSIAAVPNPKQTKIESLEHVIQGDDHFRKKAYSKAIASYTHATKLDPTSEQAQFKLAMAYALAGNLKVAIFKWQQVLRLNPNNVRARRNIEKAKARLTKRKGTKSTGTKVNTPDQKKPPSRFDSLVMQAKTAKQKGDAHKVLRATEQALEIRQDAKVAILRGEAFVALKRFEEAKKIFAKAMVINPNLAAPLYGLGYSCHASGEKERARYYFRMYIRSKAKDVKPGLLEKAKKVLESL